MGFAKGSIHGQKLWRATYRLRLLRVFRPIIGELIAELRGLGLDDAAVRVDVFEALKLGLADVLPDFEASDPARARSVPEVARGVVEELLREGGIDGDGSGD